jgi:hypothetical protein
VEIHVQQALKVQSLRTLLPIIKGNHAGRSYFATSGSSHSAASNATAAPELRSKGGGFLASRDGRFGIAAALESVPD